MRFLALIGLVCLSCGSDVDAAEPVARRIMIVSIDGLRPDLLLRGETPTLQQLLKDSSFTLWARTTPHAITLPSHTSMLTGVIPRKHQVEWNRDLPLAKPVYPKFPTIFELAKRAGFTTAMVAGKSKFSALAKPGTLDWSFIPKSEKSEDSEVTSHAVDLIEQHRPAVLFVHLPSVDNAGHKHGWSSREQMQAIAAADAAVKRLLQALEHAHVLNSTVVLITADHGGAGMTHLPDDPRARTIPWLISGPGIRKNVDLTTFPKRVVDIEDTFATASFLLGMPLDPELDGRPILEIFDRPIELLMSN